MMLSGRADTTSSGDEEVLSFWFLEMTPQKHLASGFGLCIATFARAVYHVVVRGGHFCFIKVNMMVAKTETLAEADRMRRLQQQSGAGNCQQLSTQKKRGGDRAVMDRKA